MAHALAASSVPRTVRRRRDRAAQVRVVIDVTVSDEDDVCYYRRHRHRVDVRLSLMRRLEAKTAGRICGHVTPTVTLSILPVNRLESGRTVAGGKARML